MSWTLKNMLRGAAMVRLMPPQESIDTTVARMHEQARDRGLPLDVALRRELAEVLAGQLLLTLTCVACLGAVLYGAQAQWPMAVTVGLALTPLMLCEATYWAHRWFRG